MAVEGETNTEVKRERQKERERRRGDEIPSTFGCELHSVGGEGGGEEPTPDLGWTAEEPQVFYWTPPIAALPLTTGFKAFHISITGFQTFYVFHDANEAFSNDNLL